MDKHIQPLGRPLEEWLKEIPKLVDITGLRPVFWNNPSVDIGSVSANGINKQDMFDAMERWKRFAPYLRTVFQKWRRLMGLLTLH